MLLNRHSVQRKRDVVEVRQERVIVDRVLRGYCRQLGGAELENGIYAFENGIYAFENGIYAFENGIYAFENGIYAFGPKVRETQSIEGAKVDSKQAAV